MPIPTTVRDLAAAEMLRHHLDHDGPSDPDGRLSCVCGQWREPSDMDGDEHGWDYHLADALDAAGLLAPSGGASPTPTGCHGCATSDLDTHNHNIIYCTIRPHCASIGPRIGDDAPLCVEPRDHDGRHRADPSWGDVTWRNPSAAVSGGGQP